HVCVCVCLLLFLQVWANLTSNLDRIKIVFTPMLCRRVCSGGRCYNSCEKGDVTTCCNFLSFTLCSFSAVFCQIPCMNGGRCIGRDLCWCPSNSTGKFCHLPAPPPPRPTPHSRKDASHQAAKSPSHSTYTLPLSNQHVSLHPSLVNVHIQHPPEAEVQVHQVARVQPGQRPATTDGAHSVQQRSQPGNGHEYTSEHNGRLAHGNGHWNGHGTTSILQNGHVGRCFQETVDGQCGKPLPGLTKQDDCCGSVGASWGLNKCQKCPTKPAYAVIANGQVECPKGFKRMNITHCQDINECLLPGICKNAECLNTKGSYRCTCKPGYMLDAARSHCVSDKAVSDHRASCYRSVSSGTCSLPLVNHITKQICCCSRVGKAWGNGCDRCPLPGSGEYKKNIPQEDLNFDAPVTGRNVFTAFHCSLMTPSLFDFVDVNECEMDPCEGKGHCINSYGSYTCQCHSGYSQVITQNRKFCQGETQSTVNSHFSFSVTTFFSALLDLADINECSMPNKCQNGQCVNTEGSFTCECNDGYSKSWRGLCEDVDECRDHSSCPNGICVNTLGSFQCQTCGPGFRPIGGRCVDVDECMLPGICLHGRCVNLDGTHKCTCNLGYRVSSDSKSCEDIDECAQEGICFGGVCANTEGSFVCTRCKAGYRVSEDRQRCEDIDECQYLTTCSNGICLNSEGSYTCENCPEGYQVSFDGELCQDINECLTIVGICGEGSCLNTEGSYRCMCPDGFTTTDEQDVDECSRDDVCIRGQCLNTEGSFLCLCEAGFKYNTDSADCEDIDECNNETICGSHGFCENTAGSFRCHCDQGYTNPPGDITRCVDLNECEMSSALCGEALCENVDGSFLCICPNDNEEFDPETNQCRSMGMSTVPDSKPVSTSTHITEERKDCYYNLNDVNLCNNVLSHNTTKQECCCTAGAGWGDNCEIHPCPPVGRGTLCPHGNGLLTLPGSSLLGHGEDLHANECEMFGSEICKNGQCSNFFSGYTCYCQSGYFYDKIRLECVDYDECGFGNPCENGACVNTAGSFNCFCSPPLVLDGTQRRCVNSDQDVHVDICWRRLEGDNMCAEPIEERRTTYTECCCLYGVAWSGQCAFCPRKDSVDYASMCNLPRTEGADSLRERIGYEYGVEEPELPPYWDNYERRYDSFEGLRAEECGILNGCENGRCVRVREGYTCDCFDGYELNLDKMACIDINECEDISDKVPLCQNGQCINTEGSYQCTCLPGFVASAKPHKCISAIPESTLRGKDILLEN
uniref:Latent-transforming growth factor beta-binding protein 1 n=1 Tax=Poecilia latipinna TaxID=48699 RepID=A0A3B3VK73_9TELE